MQEKCVDSNLQTTGTERDDTMTTAEIEEELSAFWADQEGVTAIEYALIGALIAVVIVASVAKLGEAVRNLYDTVVAAFP